VRAVVDAMHEDAHRSGLLATRAEFAAKYSAVACADPHWASGEIFVHVSTAFRPVTYHDGRDFVVKPNGQVELLRGLPCKLYSSACE